MELANQLQDENDRLQAKVRELDGISQLLQEKQDIIADLQRQVSQNKEVEKMTTEQQLRLDKQDSVVQKLKEQLQQMVAVCRVDR